MFVIGLLFFKLLDCWLKNTKKFVVRRKIKNNVTFEWMNEKNKLDKIYWFIK